MARLKNKWQCIPDGFWFLDAPIAADPMGPYWDYQQMLRAVQARRQANPRFGLATDLAAIDAQAEQQNAQRMLERRNCQSYVIEDPGGTAANFPVPRGKGSPNAAGVKRVAEGTGVLLDWLGQGGQAVSAPIAEERAKICADCPQNQAGDWTAWFTAPVAGLIRRQLDSRRELKLATSHDEALNVCAACSCPLKLKVHVPMAHIAGRMSAETRERLDTRCWILSETK